MIEAKSLSDFQIQKDKEAGYYIDGINMDEMTNWDFYFGKALIVTGVEKWVGQDSGLKVKIDFSTVVKR